MRRSIFNSKKRKALKDWASKRYLERTWTPTPPAQPVIPALGIKALLRVVTDYFVAGAVFQKKWGIWSCIEAAPIIAWMKRTPLEQIKASLIKMGASWEWTRIPSDFAV